MRFKILATATFGPGTLLGLTAEQAGARAYALEPAGKGLYRSKLPVQFKAGETISYEGDMPKAMAELVEKAARAPRSEKQREQPAAGAEAEAPAGDSSAGDDSQA